MKILQYKTASTTIGTSAINSKIWILVGTLLLSACGKPETTKMLSPDNQLELKTELFNPGAMATARYKVYLKQAKAQSSDFITIFDGKGGWPVSARWQGSDVVVIKSCGKSRHTAKSEISFDKRTITVRVVTNSDGYSDKFTYC